MKILIEGVCINYIKPVNPNDTRGPTWQWNQYSVIQTAICERRAGSVSCHVHKGRDRSKRPEKLFIARGKIKFTFLNSKGEKKELIVEAGTEIHISPNVKHKTEVLEDALLLEARSTHFDRNEPDTEPAEIL